jgi:lysine 2,3-aminomutase
MKVNYITKPSQVSQFSQKDVALIEQVSEKFVFRTNDYYNSLIDWNNPDDPIKNLITPVAEELVNWGNIDASDERSYQPVKGLEHKYGDTALLLCNDVCAAYCRFCFRKRLFQDENDEVVKDVSLGVEYIRTHSSITNVLLTGGDPLVMSTKRIEAILAHLINIDHVKIIRIGTKIPAFNPFRITDDPALIELFRKTGEVKQLFVVTHFNHCQELTPYAIQSIKILQQAGVTIINQTPIIRKVNDSVKAIKELFEAMAALGVLSYYVFACRPTEGNKTFALPIERSYEIFEEAQRQISMGLAKTARFIMSHKSGKIQVVGMTSEHIILKYQNAANPALTGEVKIFKREPEAYWYDDYLLQDRQVQDEKVIANELIA